MILLSVYFLVPTIGHFENVRTLAQEKETPLPFYVYLFPPDEIKLGLDLQGGIYVELEVQVEEALKNKADLLSSDLERLLKKEPFAPEKIERNPDNSEILITPKEGQSHEEISHWIRKNYNETLIEAGGQNGEKRLVYHLTKSFEDQTRNYAVQQALETIRNRIDRYGVSEPTIVRLGGNKISVELPGMTDPDRALNLIKKSGKLEFKLVDESVADDTVRGWVAETRNESNLTEDYSEQSIAKINEKLKERLPVESEILFEIQRDPLTKKIVGGTPYLLKRKAEVTGEMLKNAQVNINNNEPYVSLSFNSIGTRLFADLTKNHVGKRLAILLDDNVASAPVIREPILSGEAQITLGLGDYQTLLREADDLTLVLREGALPAKLKELTKTVVGASLGKDTIQRGMKVMLMASLVVIIFMITYYKLSGLLADIALILNILFVLAALAIFQATLTMPGIAGLVLTIGMAVDANILIFERMREELRHGHSGRSAIEAGYHNATRAILDSNITTFLAGIVLYQFGTGPIRGFAVTLMIGIVSTLVTALWVTRVLQDGILYGLKKESISV
ncbi:MAG: protein translocase subunit SecD [Deltaproteobacteria bacterium]|nr:protein translocase subunit SecD [Deltaproteobacteria bacterium]